MKERGSALLTAVIIVMVLLSISGIFFTTLIYQAKNESSEERGLKAYYLAEAGVQYGIAGIWNGTLVEGGTFERDEHDDPRLGGKFRVTVTKKEDTLYTIKSTGYYASITERTIEVGYKFIPGSEGGGEGSEDEDPPLEYPPWTPQSYGTKGTLVVNTNSEGDLKIFYNLWWAGPEQVPGEGTYVPWQEITVEWRSYNRYWKEDVVTYDGKKYLLRLVELGPITNEQPGLVNGHWQELTNEWRDFNHYAGGDIVIHNSKLFRARYSSHNQQPGLKDSPWQELTEEWRSFNIYDQNYDVYNEVVHIGNRYRATEWSQDDLPGFTNDWQLIPNSQVTEPVLVGVMVSPATASIRVGESKPKFTAKAIYSNGFTVDVTNTAVWSSSDTTKALMANGGVATGVSTGFFTGFYEKQGNKKELYPVATPYPIPVPITIPITASFEGKVGTAYLTVKGNSASGGGTPAEGFLWEKEIE